MTRKILPIYTTPGDVGGYLCYPYVFNPTGEWIGWVTEQRDVYSVLGNYVGWLSNDPRVLRKRSYDFTKPHLCPPTTPPRLRPPATVPLAPLMPELTQSTIDVLYEEPYRLVTKDFDELREDMN